MIRAIIAKVSAADKLSLAFFVLGAAMLLAAAFFIYIDLRKRRQWVARIDRMLSGLESGVFSEENWEETDLSRLEARTAHFLKKNALLGKRRLKEQQRMRQMISDISHQTKTPIANILLYGELLKEQGLLGQSNGMVEEICFQAEKLTWLVESLLKLSSLEQDFIQVSPEQRKVRPLIEKAVSDFAQRSAEKRVSLSFSCGEESAAYDAKWTMEALENLLDNALKYTPPGGEIEVSVFAYPMFLKIDVKDNGIGIPEEEQAQVFSRFYRGRGVRQEKGAGLGLYLAREIIKKQGGYMKLSSKPGQGSCFSVFLPRDGQNAGQKEE